MLILKSNPYILESLFQTTCSENLLKKLFWNIFRVIRKYGNISYYLKGYNYVLKVRKVKLLIMGVQKQKCFGRTIPMTTLIFIRFL